ncbi:MAG: hypothetical protein WD135_06480, partial [Ferruginibacter sp.]
MFKKFLFVMVIVAVATKLSAQALYDSLLTELNSSFPQEKIYMHLDKQFYTSGETLWFKAYILNGNQASKISTNLYAQLINEKGDVLDQKTMPILQAGAASHFEIPDSTKFNSLFIKAYTGWMLNFDSTLLYNRPVNIIKNSKKAIPFKNSYTFSMFPEGGDLIENITSRVAYKTNDAKGKPFVVKGNVIGPDGSVVCNFNSNHLGTGYFAISVQSGAIYKAVWKDPEGVLHETLLPNSKRNGATLRTSITNGLLKFTVERAANTGEEMKNLVVLAQINQQTVYAARLNLKNVTSATAPIPTDSLPDGIMQITLFNHLDQPLAERLVFINNNNYFFITDLSIKEQSNKPRGKNIIQLDVGGDLRSNLSVAVTDAGLNPSVGAQNNILGELLLSSDLKGIVYDAGYYFASDEDSVKQQLDLVMMTNGWRRFNWEQLLANQWPKIRYAQEDYLSIQGNIFGISSGELSNKLLTGILQTSSQEGKNFITIPIEKDGSFKMSGVYFFDTVKLYYQFNNDKNKLLLNKAGFSFNTGSLKATKSSVTELNKLYFGELPPEKMLLQNLQQQKLYVSSLNKKIKTLETVTVVATQKSIEQKLDKLYASGMFSGSNARIFAVEDDPVAQSSFSVLDYLRGRVPGLQITIDGASGGSITRRGSATSIFVNEMVTDVQLLQSTPMTQVAMIKVFDPPFFGAVGGGPGGAVAVYTKKGVSSNANIQGLNMTTLHGY